MNHAYLQRRPLQIITLLAQPWSWVLWTGASASSELLVYEDPQGRFTFSYPPGFGSPSRGTNDGFADRVAAIRFATFSSEGIGGELVVTQGPPTLDLQAAGGSTIRSRVMPFRNAGARPSSPHCRG